MDNCVAIVLQFLNQSIPRENDDRATNGATHARCNVGSYVVMNNGIHAFNKRQRESELSLQSTLNFDISVCVPTCLFHQMRHIQSGTLVVLVIGSHVAHSKVRM
jgi:hypothetical protein